MMNPTIAVENGRGDIGFMILRYILITVAAYLLGSVSSAVLISKKLFREDVRSKGSGNAGATNMARVFGMLPGILALVCDAAKTAAAMGLGWWLAGEMGLSIAGVVCVVGHCWPVFFQFHGGKGVSVGAMVSALIDWRVFVVLLLVFALAFLLSRRVSVCSITVAVLLPVLAFVFAQPLPECIMAIIVGALVVYQHRGNIVRLLHGEEAKFTPKSKS